MSRVAALADALHEEGDEAYDDLAERFGVEVANAVTETVLACPRRRPALRMGRAASGAYAAMRGLARRWRGPEARHIALAIALASGVALHIAVRVARRAGAAA